MQLLYESIATLIVPILSGFLALSGWTATQLEPLIDTYGRSALSGHMESILSIHRDFDTTDIASVIDAETKSRHMRSQEHTEEISHSLVNVYCVHATNEKRRISTASGVVIDARGVVLTNAHVVEGLFPDEAHDAFCVVRTGTSTVQTYPAKLLYAPAAWNTHHTSYTNGIRFGTGEHDFTLLYISQLVSGTSTGSLSAMDTNTAASNTPFTNGALYAGGYTEEVITEEHPETLDPHVTPTRVTHFYTFGSGNTDLVSVNGLSAFGAGASGGPIVDSSGAVVALMVTRGNNAVDGAESMRALTLSYIDRVIRAETGDGLEELISRKLNNLMNTQ